MIGLGCGRGPIFLRGDYLTVVFYT
jgi:hypothetical protein